MRLSDSRSIDGSKARVGLSSSVMLLNVRILQKKREELLKSRFSKAQFNLLEHIRSVMMHGDVQPLI